MNNKNESGRIKLLPDSVALRIAAGEVIDRPFSVIRELMDNSIDAGAGKIDLYITNGGIDNIRIVDNGTGMTRQDLEICYKPYSTSKITTLQDLDTLSTLGFRGEALSSIAACAKLKIVSKVSDQPAYKLIVDSSSSAAIEETGGHEGTLIDVSNLFYSIPARKKFLKRASAEATACKKIFLEKALPFPNIAMRFFSDSDLKSFLPVSTLKERVLAAYPGLFNKQLIHEFSENHKDFQINVIAGDPALIRKDRRYIQIYLNNRRIYEFALIQAVEYGFSEFLPGGSFPVAFIFITIDPSLIDFNIHPAKKEVKFQNLSEIHRSLVSLIKSFLASYNISYSRKVETDYDKSTEFSEFKSVIKENSIKYSDNYSNYAPVQNIKEVSPDPENKVSTDIPEQKMNIFYFGQLFNLFLLASVNNNFYFIDQHAAHEKILFNELKKGKQNSQDLLIPSIFHLEPNREKVFINDLDKYRQIGFSFENLGNHKWQLLSVPDKCSDKESVIVKFIQNQTGTTEDLETELYADIACKAAVKDGAVLDRVTAVELIEKTFNLENARCPHGRPIWFQVSRDELFQFVGRL